MGSMILSIKFDWLRRVAMGCGGNFCLADRILLGIPERVIRHFAPTYREIFHISFVGTIRLLPLHSIEYR